METKNIHFTVSNKASQLDDGRWRWKILVTRNSQVEEDVVGVDGIIMHLHPTFPERIIQLKQAGKGTFESGEYVGWGTFTLYFDVLIHGADKENDFIRLEHELFFANGCHDTHHTVPIHLKGDSLKLKRQQVCKRLAEQPYLEHDHALFWHGRGFPGSNLTPPARTWHSVLKPRDDHGETPSWLTASEYSDIPDMIQTKVKYLATLLRLSKNTVIYSGAGISSAAGIGTAARGNRKSKNLSTTAQPTLTHYALAALAKAGYIQGGWVQQNHDGLPQKAGFPQEKINEIHGSWYDPSNPVVLYSGNLKTEECKWMRHQAQHASLVLVLGTSLGGLNADQVAHNAAERSLSGRALGMVLINLQQTEHDGTTTLRIFEETDKVFQMLLDEMNIPLPLSSSMATTPKQDCVLVPYDENGNQSESVKMWWDLRPGASVKLVDGHNVVGARQPAHHCIGKGVGKVTCWRDSTMGIYMVLDGITMCLGQWWIDAAVRGGPKTLPVVNVEPKVIANDQMDVDSVWNAVPSFKRQIDTAGI